MTTTTGRHRLALSSYCWMSKGAGICADSIAPHCKGPGSAPVIEIRRGERVRFEIGFSPRTVSLAVGGRKARPLATNRNPTWRADRAGALSLFADAKTNGDASYVACIAFR